MQSALPQYDLYDASNGAPHPRASPAEPSSMQHPPLLPPIQHFEDQTGMQQPQYAPAPMNGAPLQYPPYNPGQYAQYQNGAMQPAPMPSNVDGQNGLVRYAAIPPQAPLDARHMSGGRHKKEIKRRTKTGCLTCRKRRIKCDEGQPTCRNCAKSKRECLGYDPIFKQQPGPAPIAAKPDVAASQPAATTSSLPPHPYPPSQSSYPATGGAFVEYSASLDPALGSGDQSLAMAQESYPSNIQPERKAKLIAMDDLFALHDVPPQYTKRETPASPSPAMWQEVSDFYMFHFAPGLNRLFETDWYSTHGLAALQANAELLDFTCQCVEQLKTQSDSPGVTNQIKSLEARLVWQLAAMPRSNVGNSDLAARVDTLQDLLTGGFLSSGRIPAAPQLGAELPKYDEQMFWHNLGRFVAARDDRADPLALRDVEEALGGMRAILNMMENRDVLYSLAIGRHIGGRMPDFDPSRHLVASTNDVDDPVNKLKVAHHFVEAEDARGTTQVIQRICGMALRSWALQRR